LIGLAVGGGVVWAVRIVAGLALRQEAMGFGDVTLMAMIGAVVGWQCALVSFFLAPMVAILVVLVQFAVTRQPAVPFGPYLCGGAVVSVLGWDIVWNQTFSKYVMLGEILLWILLTALVAMGVMLAIWLPIKRRLFGL
jgi:prepilin signal peptidase PulO-like enzyme (type II secretory pathway)